MKEATAVEFSENKKLGGMATTYAAIQSCPNSCPFKKTGACYGHSGPIAFQWRRLEGNTPLSVAKAEVASIDNLSGMLDLRLHTLGDCSTNAAALLVSAAAERYMKRGRRKAFTYTHAWRKVDRKSWGKVSVVASCETAADVKAAQKAGYATAMVVQSFKQDTAYEVDGVKVVPCPEQTGRCKSCAQCRLCMQDDKLKAAGVTIGFAAHGPTKKMKAVLEKVAD